MKKISILIVLFLSSLNSCLNESPTEVTMSSDFSDSIVLDLFSYNVYNFMHDKGYYGSKVTITPKGQSLLRPIDTISTLKSFDTTGFLSTVIVPKYKPNRFEAWLHDSIALIRTVESDPELLVTSNSFSMQYHFRLDTTAYSFEQSLRRLDAVYMYGYGFIIRDPIWGHGKLKIYYK